MRWLKRFIIKQLAKRYTAIIFDDEVITIFKSKIRKGDTPLHPSEQQRYAQEAQMILETELINELPKIMRYGIMQKIADKGATKEDLFIMRAMLVLHEQLLTALEQIASLDNSKK